jgi:hypothetical protein
MQTSRFELIQCWQDDRVDQVFNKEAASVDRATFLATHMPLQNLEYQQQLRRIAGQGEEAFLQELQRCATNDLHAFVVVQGIPGTGKSHFIRWLKERYFAEEKLPGEQVLFIERAQSSLRGTLEQIICSGIFDEATMHKQLEKLQGAHTALSEDALANDLLNHYMNAFSTEEAVAALPNWLKRNKDLEYFWLDPRVREELKKPGGPLDRLIRFLRKGSGAGIASHEVPQFEEGDFDFKAQVRREMQGYDQARQLAERLSGDDRRERRQQLASILNQYTRYAIGHATALTGDDFKQIFVDLRRSLYEKGYNLSLFIEDITVFTGIDRGLLDVLITQHKGESGQNLCRLISVVGITDGYYKDQVPDNVKERISYHIVLSSENTALALTEAQALDNLASRYLNALRLPQEELATWVKNGASPKELPNACERCHWRETCHRAFGSYTLDPGSADEQQIGLYPFNSRALNTFYQHIDQTKNSPTQRTFLHKVLHYMLQSHGTHLQQRAFPPALSELGGEFEVFTPTKPLQRDLIRAQGGTEWPRILTLVLIWGNRTVDAIEEPEKLTLVGNLSPEVFRAFGLPAIKGEPGEQSAKAPEPAPPPPVLPPPVEPPGHLPAGPGVQLPGKPVSNVPPQVVPEEPKINPKLKRFSDDISGWQNGGPLQYYGEYIDLLVPFMRSSIDWDVHRVSPFQIDEVLKGRRTVHIEGQVGQTQAPYALRLPRSDELGTVLMGLVELKELGNEVNPAALGGYISQLSLWLNQNEQEIVEFVRKPNETSPDTLPLLQILLLDCLLLACLQGSLRPGYKGVQDLFLDLMMFCKKTAESTGQWETQLKSAPEKRSPVWASLMQRFKLADIKDLCKNCLQLLNCSQGGSTDVKFVDAATGLRFLREFRKNRWQLPDAQVAGNLQRDTWKQALETYNSLQQFFGEAVRSEQKAIQQQLEILGSYIGQDEYSAVFQAINEMFQTAQENKRAMAFELKKQFTATGLQTTVKELRHVFETEEGEAANLRCACAGDRIETLKKYIEYFDMFVRVTKKAQPAPETLARLRAEGEAVSAQEGVQRLYQEIEVKLRTLNQLGGVQ